MDESKEIAYKLDSNSSNILSTREASIELKNYKSEDQTNKKVDQVKTKKIFVKRPSIIVIEDREFKFMLNQPLPDNHRKKIVQIQNELSMGERGRDFRRRYEMGQNLRRSSTCLIKHRENISEKESDAMSISEKNRFKEAKLDFKYFLVCYIPEKRSYAMSIKDKTQAKEAEIDFEYFLEY